MKPNDKIVSFDELKEIVSALRKERYKICLTDGCFDLLGLDHVKRLETAREMADILIVGVYSDSSVKLLKGKCKPIMDENSRAEMLAALNCVDYVVVFSEQSASKLIEEIKPDAYVRYVLVRNTTYKVIDLF